MKEQFPKYNIEHLNDTNNQQLDFEIIIFNNPEDLLKKSAREELKDKSFCC